MGPVAILTDRHRRRDSGRNLLTQLPAIADTADNKRCASRVFVRVPCLRLTADRCGALLGLVGRLFDPW